MILLAGALASAGCGGGTSSQSNPEQPGLAVNSAESVAADDVASVLNAEDSINTACGLVQNEQGSDIPLPQAIKTLQGIYRQNPEGTVAGGVSYTALSMKTIVKTYGKRLSSCGKTAEAQQLMSVLKS